MKFLRLLLLLPALAFGQGATLPYNPGNISSGTVTATGSTTPRTMADRAADVVNIKDFGGGAGGDDTAAFNAAVARALALTGPATIYLPCGNYTISSAIAITLPVSTTHGVYIKGENVGCATVTQNADADGFDFTINNFGPNLFSSGAVGVSGLTLAMTGTSTTKVGISITTSASSGAQGIPTIVDHVNFTSVDGTHYWGKEIDINEVTGCFVDHINGTYPAAAVGTHLSIQGNSTSYSAACAIHDLYYINGTGIELGNYVQGLHFQRLNIHAVASGYAIHSAPSAGSNLDLQFADSYLLGRVYWNPSGTATLASVKYSNTYFDALGTVIPTNDFLVAFNNVNRLSMNNNTYSCTGGSSGISGLSLVGTFVTTTINDEQMVDCPVGVAVNATTFPIKFSHVQFRPNNAAYVNVVDTSSGVQNIFGADLSLGNNLGTEQYQFPAWTTNGVGMGGQASVVTDTTTNATIPEEAMFAFPANTLTLSTGHTGTVTNVYTLYVPAPLCSNAGGGTLTCTNLNGIDSNGTIRSTGGSGIVSTSGGQLQGGVVSCNPSSNNNCNLNTGTSTGTTTLGGTTAGNIVNVATVSYRVGNVLYGSVTAPTINSHFNTSSDSITAASTAAFRVTVGTGAATNTGSLTFPAATTGWSCKVTDATTNASFIVEAFSTSTTAVTVNNYSRTTGAATNFTNSEKLDFLCGAF